MKQIFFGEVFYCCDNIAINVPSKLYLIEEIKNGRLPLFNPYILSNSPFLADINLGLLYPLNLLYFFLSPFRALTTGVVIDFLVAAIGIYVFSKSLKISDFGSVVVATVFTFSGTMVTYINNVPLLQVASLVPWVLWAWMKFFDYPTKKQYLILVLALTLQIFAGHPQLTYYTWLLGFSYVAFVSPLAFKKRLGLLGLLEVLVFLLTSIQIIPFLQLARFSTRIGLGFAYASFDSLNPVNIFRLINPNIVGNLSKGTDWLQGGSIYGYVGVLPLLLILAVPLKNIQVRFFLFTAAVSFLLALGKFTPVFFVAYKFIPGVGSFRSPQHFLLLYTFSIAVLAGYGIDEAFRVQKKVFYYSQFVLGVLLLILGVWFIELGKYPFMLLPKFRLLSSVAQGEVIFLTIGGFFTTSFFLFIAHFFQKRLVLFFIILLSLFLFSSHGLISVGEKTVLKWQQAGREMANRMPDTIDTYRIFISPALYANPVKKQFGVQYQELETAWQIEILRTNINMLYHLSTIDGYASLIYRPYKELFQKGEGDPTGIQFGDMSTINWNALSVRYVLARPDESVFKTNPLFVSIWHDSNKVLYENTHARQVKPINTFHYSSVVIGGIFSLAGSLIFLSLVFFGRRPGRMSQSAVRRYLPKAKRRARYG